MNLRRSAATLGRSPTSPSFRLILTSKCKICTVISPLFGVLWFWLRLLDFLVGFVQYFALLEGFCFGCFWPCDSIVCLSFRRSLAQSSLAASGCQPIARARLLVTDGGLGRA